MIIRTILSIVDTLSTTKKREKELAQSCYSQLTAPNTPITNRLMTNDINRAIATERALSVKRIVQSNVVLGNSLDSMVKYFKPSFTSTSLDRLIALD